MKIKIKNNNQQIFKRLYEGESNAEQTLAQQDPFEATAEHQYILQRKREALPVNIIAPQDFTLPIKLPTPPEDINNIMSSYQNNKARKTKNIGGVMQDPIQTFNNADACCRDAFGNFFSKKIKFEKDENKRKENKLLISKADESYNYNDFPVLNESATTVGLTIGTGIGSILLEIISAGVGATAGLAATVGAQVAALGGSAFMIGYWGEELFGNVEGGGISNDKVAAHLNAESQQMLKVEPADPQKYTDIVEAISTYVKDIMESCVDVANILVPNEAPKLDELSKFIGNFMGTLSKNAEEFIEAHSKQIEEEKELARQKRENDAIRKQNRAESSKDFIKTVMKITSKMGPFAIKTAYEIVEYYDNANANNRFKLENAVENADDNNKWRDLFNTYNKLRKAENKTQDNDEESNNVGESLHISQSNSINEADLENGEMTNIENAQHDSVNNKKLKINASNIYDKLLIEFESRFKEVFSKIDRKSLPKYEETKEQMKALIDSADKSINAKIEQIAKVQTGETSATGGLGQAAKTFLLGHPLESNNLKEVWSRHLADLNMRMTNRLNQMTDYTNKTRTLGWTLYVCRTVVPKVLARMLTYRYIYAILSNEGFFSYDSAAIEEDKKAFQQDKDIYVNLPKTLLISILNDQGKEYTYKNEGILVADEVNGGWKLLPDNFMSYAFFLIGKLSDKKGNNSIWVKCAEFLANIKNFVKEQDQVNQMLNLIANTIPEEYKEAVFSKCSDEKLKELQELFKMPDDIIAVKQDIYNTYQLLLNQSKNLPTDQKKLINIKKTLDLISIHPKHIYDAYLQNKDNVDKLIQEVNNNEKPNVKDELIKIFGDNINTEDIKDNDYTNINEENIRILLPDDQNNDFYSYILNMFPLQGNIIWDENGKAMSNFKGETVKHACKVVADLLPLEFSGLLAYALEEDINEEKTNKELFEQCKILSLPLYEYYIINNDNAPDEIKAAIKEPFDNIYNNIAAKYKEITKESNYSLELSEDIFKNFITALHTNQIDKIGEYKIIANPTKEIKDPKQQLKDFEGNAEEYNKIIDDMYTTIIEAIKTDKNNYDLLRNCIIAADEVLKESQQTK